MEREKLTVKRAVVVEGKYDKIKLSQIIDAAIYTSDGFGIFKEKEKRELIKRIAKKRGLIVLTDSDSAGMLIRNYFNSFLDKEDMIHLYTPEVKGKERRKKEYSKEGILGVEGSDCDLLYNLFLPYSGGEGEIEDTEKISGIDLYNDGFSGCDNSEEKRKALARALSLPQNLSKKALVEAINMLGGKKLYEEAKEKSNVETI